MAHFYGLIKDTIDTRDYRFQAVHKPEQLPIRMDLRTVQSPVRDQGQMGSCTAFAIVTGLRECIQIKNLGSKKFVLLSPLDLYYNERVKEGSVRNCQAGAMIRTGMSVLTKQGVCPDSSWKYIISKCGIKPTSSAREQEKKYKIFTYARVGADIISIKSAIAAGHPVVMGFDVYESFETISHNGIMPMPKPGESYLGGHAVLAVGYDDITQLLVVKNSWGTGWGYYGYFFMPYGATVFMADLWTATN